MLEKKNYHSDLGLASNFSETQHKNRFEIYKYANISFQPSGNGCTSNLKILNLNCQIHTSKIENHRIVIKPKLIHKMSYNLEQWIYFH